MYKMLLLNFFVQNENDKRNLEEGWVSLNPGYITNMGD